MRKNYARLSDWGSWLLAIGSTILFIGCLIRRSSHPIYFSRYSETLLIVIIGMGLCTILCWCLVGWKSRRERFLYALINFNMPKVVESLGIGIALCCLLVIFLGQSLAIGSSYMVVIPLVIGIMIAALSMREPDRSLRYFLIQLVIVLFLLEGAIAIYRDMVPTSKIAQLLYGGDRNIIQFMSCCARYDVSLTYTLKPGEFSFSNIEFKTQYRVNHMGLRDDEESLNRPEIIVLGDSQAMGWGVEQDETFAAIIEQESGLRVLNTGVSSYGTAREILMLQRINTDAAAYIVILYDPTDYVENVKFNDGGGTLETMSKETYDSTVSLYLRQQRYYPGKYTNTLVRPVLFGRLPRLYLPTATSDDHAKEFIGVLINGKVASLNSRLVVIGRTEGFIAALRKNLLSNNYTPGYRRINSLGCFG